MVHSDALQLSQQRPFTLCSSRTTFHKPRSVQDARTRPFSSSCPIYSGHSKWSKIKHDKSRVDSQRAQTYGRLSNGIVHAAAAGPDSPALSDAVAAAKKAGMTKSAIDSAVQRGTGRNARGEKLQDVRIEALVPQRGSSRSSARVAKPSADQGDRIALLIECQTSSKAKTLQEVRLLVNDHRGIITPTAHMFQHVGRIRLHEREWYCRPGDPQGELEDMLIQVLDIQEHVGYTSPDEESGGKDMPDVLLDFDYPQEEVAKRIRNENNQDMEHRLSDFIVDTWAPSVSLMANKLQEIYPTLAINTETIWLPKEEFAVVVVNGEADSEPSLANATTSTGFHKLIQALEQHGDVKAVWHNWLD
ncbi:MAG: hypothetical protein M1831_002003 [Alyxoria varia]|nr:MAG: hypothetical protein M1831_002003 [Alyxoria varia]